MRALRCLGAILSRALLVLPLLTLPALTQEVGHPEAGHDPRRGVESDEAKRDIDGRREDRRDNVARDAASRNDLVLRQNSEFHDAKTLSAEIRSDESQQIKISEKIDRQIKERGWNEQEIHDLIKKGPNGTSIDGRNGNTDSASVYGEPGRYVVVNDRTKEIVQISDKNDPSWNDDRRITWKKGP